MKSKSSLNLLLLVQLATYSFLVNAQTPTDAPTSSPTVSTTVEGNAILAWIVFVIVCIICPGGICFACYYHVAKNRLRVSPPQMNAVQFSLSISPFLDSTLTFMHLELS